MSTDDEGADSERSHAKRVSDFAARLASMRDIRAASHHTENPASPTQATTSELRALSDAIMSPALPLAARAALLLNIAAGLDVRQLADAFGIDEETMQIRIDRSYDLATAQYAPATTSHVEDIASPETIESFELTVSLLFDEGYVGSQALLDSDSNLSTKAIEIARLALDYQPQSQETRALLATMLFKHARRRARTRADGTLESVWNQDRSMWDRQLLDEAQFQARRARTEHPGRFGLEACAEYLICTPNSLDEIEWGKLLSIYEALCARWPSAAMHSARIIVHARARGVDEAYAELRAIELDPRLTAELELELAKLTSQ